MGILGTALGVAGGLMGAFGDKKASDASAKAYGIKADYAVKNQGLLKKQFAIDTRRLNSSIYKNRGANMAQTAAGGMRLLGSSLDILRESAANAAMDRQTSQLNFDTQMNDLKMEEDVNRANSKGTKKGGKMGFLGNVLKIGSSFL